MQGAGYCRDTPQNSEVWTDYVNKTYANSDDSSLD